MTKVKPGKAASAGPGPLANEAGYADVRNSPNSVTFMSLSYVFAETVNQAGRVDDAQGHLANLLAGHEKIWNCLLLFDTLYFSTLLPLLVVGPADLEPAEGMSDALASALFDAFDVLIAMSVCIVVLHTFVVIILYFGAAYVQSFPAETTAWFLLKNRNLFIFSYLGNLPSVTCAMLGTAVSCVLTRGITVGSMTIVALIGLVIVAQFVIFCHTWPPLKSRLRQELDAQKNKQSL